MGKIQLLDQITIDKIAAGEVVERPSSIVKELVENAIDAGANAITVEIRSGGIQLIRITDNGSGIPADQVRDAFLRHATSKIRAIDDLQQISSLGFRGEALSSIAAVAQVELITKTPDDLIGTRYVIEGGVEKTMEEIGAPSGTTFLIRNLFYNTPARAKFLKSPTTEGSYIGSLMEQLSLSHPDISFKFMMGGQTRITTSGNGNLKEVIYQIYGRDVTKSLLEVQEERNGLKLYGFIGKPSLNRGNRGFENYYVNGRYVKNNIITKAIEDGYRSFLMQHRFPYTTIFLDMSPELVDVNVHPSKKEVRFSDQEMVYRTIYRAINDILTGRELIPEVSFERKKTKVEKNTEAHKVKETTPEPFEVKRKEAIVRENSGKAFEQEAVKKEVEEKVVEEPIHQEVLPSAIKEEEKAYHKNQEPVLSCKNISGEQMELFSDKKLLDEKNKKLHRIIGQVFDTYWLVQMEDKLFIIDQHAAHEKVLFEHFMNRMKSQENLSQNLAIPLVVSLDLAQAALMDENLDKFRSFGFEIEHFGGREYSVRAVPYELYGNESEDLFIGILDGLAESHQKVTHEIFAERIATMACKAAVKGNHAMTLTEAQKLIDELLTLENPYNCPHGRPTIISMSKYEMEKKFKRIL